MSEDFKEIVGRLTPDQRRRLAQKVAQRRAALRFPPEQPVPPGEPAALSYAQERMWLLDQISPGNSAWNIPFAVRVGSGVDVPTLESALTEISRRHAILRTVFRSGPDGPRQVVMPACPIEIPVVHLREGTGHDRAALLTRRFKQETQRGFELAVGPMLRATLMVDDEERILVVVAHHAVFDAWSIDLFVCELEQLCGAAVNGRSQHLAELPAQFADWAVYQRDRLENGRMSELLEYWQRRLRNAPAVTTVPTDFPRPEAQRREPAQCAVALPGDLVGRLEEFARAAHTTVNVVVMAAFAVVLHGETGATDLVLGMSVAARAHPAVEPLIGCFANTVAVRVDLSGDPSLNEVVRRVHLAVVDSYEHYEAPFVRVVEAVAPPRSSNRNPIFQILFSLSGGNEVSREDEGDALFEPVAVEAGAADFDLLVSLNHRAGQVTGRVGYDGALYLPGTIDGLFAGIAEVLDATFAGPEQRLSQLDSLRREQLRFWSSFDDEGVGDAIRAWLRTLRARADVHVVESAQAALDPDERPDDPVVCLVRWEDLLSDADLQSAQACERALAVAAADLGDRVRKAVGGRQARILIGLFPPSERLAASGCAEVVDRHNDWFAASLAEVNGVEVVRPEQWTERYRLPRKQQTPGRGLSSQPFRTAAAAELVRRLVRPDTGSAWTVVVVAPDGSGSEPDLSAALVQGVTRRIADGRSLLVVGASGARPEHDRSPEQCIVLTSAHPAVGEWATARPGVMLVPCPDDGDDLNGFLDHLWALDAPGDRPGLRSAVFDADRLAFVATHLTSVSAVTMHALAFTQAPVERDAVTERIAPRDHVEQRVSDVWVGILPAGDADMRQDFFDAGGHSLLALRLLGAIRDEWGISVPLGAFLAEPTVARLARAVREGEGDRPQPIPVVPRTGPLELSPAQQRYWAANRMGDDPGRFNITYAARVRGPLDVEALRTAVAAVVERHEVLRSTYPDMSGRPVAVSRERSDHWLAPVDLAQVPERDRAVVVAEYVHEHCRHVFDLATGPLLRVRVLIESSESHVLLFGMHHIISDNASWEIFLRELGACYQAAVGTAVDELAPLPVQFADYAVWQRQWLEGPAAAEELAYWAQELADAPALSAPSTDHPRPAIASNRAARTDRLLAPDLGPRLRELCRRRRVTPFTALLTAFAAMLRRYGCGPDLVVGTPVSGRYRAETEPLIGCLTDLVPIRLEVADALTFAELSEVIGARVTGAQSHQEVPFAAVLAELRPPRSPAFHPVFQCVFNYIDPSPVGLGQMTLEPLPVPEKGLDFDLFLTVSWQGERLDLTLSYATDIFAAGTAAGMLDTFESMLADALSNEGRRVAELASGPGFRLPAVAPGTGAVIQPPVATLQVVSTFTAEPFADSVQFWTAALGRPCGLDVATVGQVVQGLLDPDGHFSSGQQHANIVLLRWQDLLPPEARTPTVRPTAVENAVHELFQAVLQYRQWSAVPLVIGVCPASAPFRSSSARRAFDRATARLADAVRAVTDTGCADLGELLPAFALTEIDDLVGENFGRMPYTREAYAVLGTALAFALAEGHAHPVETIVVPAALVASAGADALNRYLRGLLRRGRRLVVAGGELPAELAHPRSAAVPDASLAEFFLRSRNGSEPVAESSVALVGTELAAEELRSAVAGLTVLVAAGTVPFAELLHRPLWGDHGPTSWKLPAGAVCELTRAADGPTLLAQVSRDRAAAAEQPYAAPASPAEEVLARLVADLLRVERVSAIGDFFDLGGDSLLAIQLVSQAAREGMALTPRMIMTLRTVRSLAEAAGSVTGSGAAESPYSGPVPITAPQRWFLHEIAPTLERPSHFNHPYYLALRRPARVAHLERALSLLVSRHESLRSRFSRADDAWTARIAPADIACDLLAFDLSQLDPQTRDRRLSELVADQQTGLDLAAGPLTRAAYFDLGPDEPPRLLIVNHHLVVDAVSRGVLLAELELLLDAMEAGRDPALPPLGTTAHEWARRSEDFAASPEVRQELDFWLAQARPEHSSLSVDAVARPVTIDSIRVGRTSIGAARAVRLRARATRSGLSLPELLAGAVADLLAEYSGGGRTAMYVVNHGRPDFLPDLDVSQTVGWFQTKYPVAFEVPVSDSAWQRATAVSEQLKLVPRSGLGYAALLYQSPDPEVRMRLREMPKPQVSFNYMGEFGINDLLPGTRRFTSARGAVGASMDERGIWPQLLDFFITAGDAGLRIEVNYSHYVHRGTTIDRMLDGLVSRLDQISQEATQ